MCCVTPGNESRRDHERKLITPDLTYNYIISHQEAAEIA